MGGKKMERGEFQEVGCVREAVPVAISHTSNGRMTSWLIVLLVVILFLVVYMIYDTTFVDHSQKILYYCFDKDGKQYVCDKFIDEREVPEEKVASKQVSTRQGEFYLTTGGKIYFEPNNGQKFESDIFAVASENFVLEEKEIDKIVKETDEVVLPYVFNGYELSVMAKNIDRVTLGGGETVVVVTLKDDSKELLSIAPAKDEQLPRIIETKL